MKTILLGIFMFVVALPMWAVPARPFAFKVTQPDGTQLTVRAFGDEHFHGLVTEDGTVVKRDAAGWYRSVNPDTLEMRRQRAIERKQQINQTRSRRALARRAAIQGTQDIGDRQNFVGEKRGLVILVNFKDATISSSRQTFDDMFNKSGYSENNHIGSVKDYFRDQSYGKLNITFDVVGPVTVSKNYAYYGGNDPETDSDMRPAVMISEACKLANSQVDYSKYDWDGDGTVDQVYVIYAGYGENYNGTGENHVASIDDTIWPHEWDLASAQYDGEDVTPLYMDGVYVNTYACSAELAYTSGTTLNGIGTACHEFSHCLGVMDHYDVSYNCCPTMGEWDLMDGGGYNGPNYLGEVPAGFTAYERWYAGWMDLNELTDGCEVTNMPNLGDSACAYVIYNEGARCEAYLLENRQNSRWFAYPNNAHGMLIYHVDYDATAWYNDSVNVDASHPRMSIVPANNTYGTKYSYADEGLSVYYASEEQQRGQVWPGTMKKTTLANFSTPAAKTFNANSDGKYYLNAPITKIAESNGTISFTFKGGSSATGIEAVEDIQQNNETTRFDLFGRAVKEGENIIQIFNNNLIILKTK